MEFCQVGQPSQRLSGLNMHINLNAQHTQLPSSNYHDILLDHLYCDVHHQSVTLEIAQLKSYRNTGSFVTT